MFNLLFKYNLTMALVETNYFLLVNYVILDAKIAHLNLFYKLFCYFIKHFYLFIVLLF